jgi:hypothetical protein
MLGMNATQAVVVGSIPLTLDQVVEVVRQLDPVARERVARALLETDMDARLAALIRRLAQRQAADDLSDTDIDAEVVAVRRAGTRAQRASRRR